MITAEQLDDLVRRYAPAEDQRCVVCGAPLQFSASGERGGLRYNCSSAAARPGLLPGIRERIEHYQASAWIDRGLADPVVVALVAAYRELEPRAACPCFDAAAESQLRTAVDLSDWNSPEDAVYDVTGGETDG
jgi:hypothetical protein